MAEIHNFKLARDNETDDRYLGTRWVVFRRFDIEERTEHDVRVCAPHDDPGLPKYRKRLDGSKVRSYSGDWLFKDDNAWRAYAPLKDEPDLFVKFASLASRDPGTRDGRYEIMVDWITQYGVLGLRKNPSSNSRSERHERLSLFWIEVRRAAQCMALYEAATGPARVLKRSGLPGKTLAEKRKLAIEILTDHLGRTLRSDCYPKLYYSEREDELAEVALNWGFHSLRGAMYLQMAWRITSRRCEAPGCNNIIGLHERSDKHTCSLRCKERRRQHRLRAPTV